MVSTLSDRADESLEHKLTPLVQSGQTANTQLAQLHARYTGTSPPLLQPRTKLTQTAHRNRTCRHDQVVRLALPPTTTPLTPSPPSEWFTHQHRDTYSSILGHPTLLNYTSISDGEATGRMKFELAEVRVRGRSRRRELTGCGCAEDVAALWASTAEGG